MAFGVLLDFFEDLFETLRGKEFQGLLLLVLLVLLAGTVSYHVLEGWDFVDSLYFTVVTLTTIGFGDLAPKTSAGKLFTVAYIFVGLGLILAFINQTAKIALEKHHQRIMVREKNLKKTPSKK